MKILAIETATEACSAALEVDNERQVRFEVAPRKHTGLILPMIDELLANAGIRVSDLDAIAFGRGPGAFTGVRIAVGVTQGLAFAHDIPVVPVSSLATLAQQFADKHDYIATAFDARIQEVYWGLYQRNDQGLVEAMIGEEVCVPEQVTLPSKHKWHGAGTGWNSYTEQLTTRMDKKISEFDGDALPSARETIDLAKPVVMSGKAIDVGAALPTYLRDKVV